MDSPRSSWPLAPTRRQWYDGAQLMLPHALCVDRSTLCVCQVRLLLERGADPNVNAAAEGLSALHCASSSHSTTREQLSDFDLRLSCARVTPRRRRQPRQLERHAPAAFARREQGTLHARIAAEPVAN
jgi:hypothetical protein